MTVIRKLSGNFTETAIDNEIILMRLDNGELLSLTDSAAAVWRLIDGQCDRSALVASLSVEYDADEQVIARDVGELLQQLNDARLIAEE